jgi:polysaccharide deacetylase family protein (PEP-CTERM system associated)
VTRPVIFTLDLEDHRPDDTAEIRYPDRCRVALDFLDERRVTGTFFVVGEVAEAQPDLVREVADRGHELALHGWTHTHLTELEPRALAEQAARGRALLEDLAGRSVTGFRAPTFSLVPSTVWATEVLVEQGFTYSSSVLAARNPLFGFPGAPRTPFLWPSGLAEFPAPLAGLGPFTVPYLGGTYLRLLPSPVVAVARRVFPPGPTPWTYLHPYDLDPDEPYWRVPDAGALSPLLWVGRRHMLGKLDRLLAQGAGVPLGEHLDDARRGGVFHPEAR